ncbi:MULTISPECIES: hypothetical protein [Nostocales]|uniref:hypothetical protein n=1 Tax=Nostocales TaxID=1161 RepID=UPI0038B631E7
MNCILVGGGLGAISTLVRLGDAAKQPIKRSHEGASRTRLIAQRKLYSAYRPAARAK